MAKPRTIEELRAAVAEKERELAGLRLALEEAYEERLAEKSDVFFERVRQDASWRDRLHRRIAALVAPSLDEERLREELQVLERDPPEEVECDPEIPPEKP